MNFEYANLLTFEIDLLPLDLYLNLLAALIIKLKSGHYHILKKRMSRRKKKI